MQWRIASPNQIRRYSQNSGLRSVQWHRRSNQQLDPYQKEFAAGDLSRRGLNRFVDMLVVYIPQYRKRTYYY